MSEVCVTAIITAFNEEAYIRRAVSSLLKQTLSDIEVLVIDDGSTDNTVNELDKVNDKRLRIIQLARRGRAASLAFACEHAKGEYIANLDADDISHPDRLEKQVTFLTGNKAYAWVGCGEEREDSQRNESFMRVYPESDQDIRRQSAKCIPYCHSGVMFRMDLIKNGLNYDPEQKFLIDFEFFLRVASKFKVANLPDILVKRHVRNESYFQSRFSTALQNRRLASLCARAVNEFDLPIYYYFYSLARHFYPLLPNYLKQWIRINQGLRESHD